MNKVFLTSKEVEIRNGYLSSNKSKEMAPIGHSEFIEAQEDAEYIVTFAKMAKGKNFKGVEPIDLEEFRKTVEASLSKKGKEYVKSPKKPTLSLTEQLKEEAMKRVNFDVESSKATEINEFMSRFDVITEYEEVGLFFDQQIVKINRIYTIEEITNAVQEVIDLL
jgi:galactitol-specific phosphotransferase system IIB component